MVAVVVLVDVTLVSVERVGVTIRDLLVAVKRCVCEDELSDVSLSERVPLLSRVCDDELADESLTERVSLLMRVVETEVVGVSLLETVSLRVHLFPWNPVRH